MRAGLAAAGAIAAAGSPWLALAAKPGGGTTVRYPLYIPPAADPRAAASLRAAQTFEDLGGGKISSALTYNGSFPGPTFRARSGDVVDVRFSNALVDETTVHWHGMLVPTAMDGQPQEAIAPGGSYTYGYRIIQRAAMNWYHPHPHHMTGEQVAIGLAGAFLINDAEEDALDLPDGPYEVPLVLRDANLDRAGNLLYNPTSSGFLGKVPLVNGTRSPYLSVDRAVYRLRVLNGATARIFRIALGNGALFTLIGNDGGLLRQSVPIAQIEFSPGERLDLLVDFRALGSGGKVMLRDMNAGWDLLEFRGTGVPSGLVQTIPTALSSIAALPDPGTPTRTFSFDGMTRINGQEFDMNRIDFEVPFGVTERWRFTTGGNAPHPIHIHGASFQVVSRSGGRGTLYSWEGGWKDTVLLQDGETVDVLIRFDAYRGRYLMHCHKLEHEDQGMMTNFLVV